MSRAPIRTTARPGMIHVSPKAYGYDWWRIGLLAALVVVLVALVVS